MCSVLLVLDKTPTVAAAAIHWSFWEVQLRDYYSNPPYWG